MRNVSQSGQGHRISDRSHLRRILHRKAKLMYFIGGPTTGIGATPSRLKKEKKFFLNYSRVQEVAHKWKVANYEVSHFLIIL